MSCPHHPTLRLTVRRTAGFTLIETMVVVAIVAILGAMAAPSMKESIDRYQVNAAYDELRSTYLFARSEALRTRSTVIVQKLADERCPDKKDWQCGWIVFVDVDGNGSQNTRNSAEKTIRQTDMLANGITLSNNIDSDNVRVDRWGNFVPTIGFSHVIAPKSGRTSPATTAMCVNSGNRIRKVEGKDKCS